MFFNLRQKLKNKQRNSGLFHTVCWANWEVIRIKLFSNGNLTKLGRQTPVMLLSVDRKHLVNRCCSWDVTSLTGIWTEGDMKDLNLFHCRKRLHFLTSVLMTHFIFRAIFKFTTQRQCYNILSLCVLLSFVFFFITNTLIVKDRKFDNNWNMTPKKVPYFTRFMKLSLYGVCSSTM